jgi:hypothetical protein
VLGELIADVVEAIRRTGPGVTPGARGGRRAARRGAAQARAQARGTRAKTRAHARPAGPAGLERRRRPRWSSHFGEYVDSAIYLLTAQSVAAGRATPTSTSPLRAAARTVVAAPASSRRPRPRGAQPLHGGLRGGGFAGVASLRRLHGRSSPLAALLRNSRLSVQSFNKVFAEFRSWRCFGAVAVTPAPGEARAGWRRGLLWRVLLSVSCWLRSVGLLALPASR